MGEGHGHHGVYIAPRCLGTGSFALSILSQIGSALPTRSALRRHGLAS
jgi:hypothetical protein